MRYAKRPTYAKHGGIYANASYNVIIEMLKVIAKVHENLMLYHRRSKTVFLDYDPFLLLIE